jgi:chromosome segregation ATPase
MPDSVESRVSRLEQSVASLRAMSDTTTRDLNEVRPLRVGLVEVAHDVHDLRQDLGEMRQMFREHAAKLEQAQERRDQREREHQDRATSDKWKRIGVAVALACAAFGSLTSAIIAIVTGGA